MPKPELSPEPRPDLYRKTQLANAVGSRLFGIRWLNANEAATASALAGGLDYTHPKVKFTLMRTVLLAMVIGKWGTRDQIPPDILEMLNHPEKLLEEPDAETPTPGDPGVQQAGSEPRQGDAAG